MLGEADHHREDVLADALRVGARRVDDLDAVGGRGGDVDVVEADPVAADDLQPLRPVQDLPVDPTGGSEDQAVDLADGLLESDEIRGAGGPDLDRLVQEAHPGLIHTGQHQNDGPLGHAVSPKA